MPYATDFYGSLVTDKPIPDHVQEQLLFLCDLDIRSLATPVHPVFRLQDALPDGFPAQAAAALVEKGIYRVPLYAESDTQLSVADEEYVEISPAALQFVIDEFLKPNGINATGRIEAAGESGASDLWCIVVGEDQKARPYDGAVVYADQPGYPADPTPPASQDASAIAPAAARACKRGAELAEAAIGLFLEYRDSHGYDEDSAQAKAIDEIVEGEQARVELEGDLYDATPVEAPTAPESPSERIARLILGWAGVDPTDLETVEGFIDALGHSSIPEAAATITDGYRRSAAEESYCDECQAETEPGFESAPSPDHYDTCSLYTPDPENE